MTLIQKELSKDPKKTAKFDSIKPITRRMIEMLDSLFIDASSIEVNIIRICMLLNISVIIIFACFYETIEGWFKW